MRVAILGYGSRGDIQPVLVRQKNLIGLGLMFALFVLPGGSPGFAPDSTPTNAQTVAPVNDVPWRLESRALRLMDDLDEQGYEVLRGCRLFTSPGSSWSREA